MSPTKPLEQALRWISSRGGRVWTAPVAATGWLALRRGALAPVVEEACRRTDLPAHLRLQMIGWAVAVTKESELPARFRPGQQIQRPEARQAALAALRAKLRTEHWYGVAEQIVAIDDNLPRRELVELASTDLAQRVELRSIRPKRGTGVDPHELTSIVDDVVARLERVGITPFLMSGTLLGFIREGTFLDHDHDVRTFPRLSR